jgi:SAM-dependent methyltransferase
VPYVITQGVPILLADPGEADADELEHHHGRRRQSDYFDREVMAEFETERPHRTPWLYRWLLGEKFRRSLRGIEQVACTTSGGGFALVVCGGSGMDAEFLARTGMPVVLSDVSLGAALRARERARRYRLPIAAVVADVRTLPFADEAARLVYVHDGLHHLADPGAAVREMARVASQAISITEPARALATRAAVRLGLAREVEEAGNRVARLEAGATAAELERLDFRVSVERYAMYYRHEPGRVERALSVRSVRPPVALAWRLGNAVIGRQGNKLAIRGHRL